MATATIDWNLRATDADREQCAQALRWAAGEGALTIEELDERLSAVYGAVLRRDLPALLADLPRPEPVPPRLAPEHPSRYWVWALVPWMAAAAWAQAAFVTRQDRYWKLVAVYSLPLIAAMLAAPGAGDDLPGWAAAVGGAFWVVGAVHAWSARPTVDAERMARTAS